MEVRNIKNLNLAVIGIGGVGGYVGAKLADTFAGNAEPNFNIFFIARGKHLKTIQKNGINLYTSGRSINCKPDGAFEDISDLPAIDIFIIAVKGYDLKNIAIQIKNYVDENTVILPLLNGVDIYERLRNNINKGIILPACIYISSHIKEPGIIKHTSGSSNIIFGRDPRHSEYNADNLKNIFKKASLKYEWKNDAAPAIWKKYIFIASFALVSACHNITLGEILTNKSFRKDVTRIMTEIKIIADSKNIGLNENIIEQTLEKVASFPGNTKSSLQRDVEKNSSRNELNIFGKTIINLGKELGIKTPTTQKFVREIEQQLQ